jgi:tRNA dimethylallyltransferase
MSLPVIVILGPTASGKTKLATHLATRIGAEIISADSRQVYRKMDIGTGKDYNDYVVNGQQIPYHLIDILDAGEKYNVARFQEDFSTSLQNIQQRNKIAILCGGTGLYIDAVLRDLTEMQVPVNEELRSELAPLSNEELMEKARNFSEQITIDFSTRKRLIRGIERGNFLSKNPSFSNTVLPRFSYKIFGLQLPVELRRERITKRLQQRLQHEGMIDEVQQLLATGVTPEQLIYYGLEYKFITEFLTQKLTYNEMQERLNVAIHQFAKRQMTFFRSMGKRGLPIQWLDATLPTNELVEQVTASLYV